MATLKAVTVGERIEIERAQIESVGHPELRGEFLDLREGFGLHLLRVGETGGFRTRPGTDDDAGIFREKVRQGKNPLRLEGTPHPSDDETALGIVLPFHRGELGNRRGHHPDDAVILFLRPTGIAIEDLSRDPGHGHAFERIVGAVDETPARVIPGMEHEGGGTLRQAGKVAVAEEPGRRIHRSLPRHLAAGKATLFRRVEQGHVVGLRVERGPLAHPLRQGHDVAQDRRLSTTQSEIMGHKTRIDAGEVISRGHGCRMVNHPVL